MKEYELVPGQIYYTNLPDNNNLHILKYKSEGFNGMKTFGCINETRFNDYDRYFHTSYQDNFRLATDEEKQWFLECESQNKFIPLSEITIKIDEFSTRFLTNILKRYNIR